jgi:MbtH protein
MDLKVIVSTQEQYSIWPAGAEIPLGWSETEVEAASLAQCLAYIGRVWLEESPAGGEPAFVVTINDDDMLSVSLAGAENAPDWRTVSEPVTLDEALAFIGRAWSGAGPLPEPFRPGTGESAPDAG